MCNQYCIEFGKQNLRKEEITGKRIIEVGSYDVNGSLRPFVAPFKPEEYIGVDIVSGPGVDLICDIRDIVIKFGEESFDVVISTELIEHVKEWRMAIHNIKKICKEDGIILITTRSRRFPYHGFPNDFWRFEVEDMEYIFHDCRIEKIEKDPQSGIFTKATKPRDFIEQDLSDHALYSIITGHRIQMIKNSQFIPFYVKRLMSLQKLRAKNLIRKLLC